MPDLVLDGGSRPNPRPLGLGGTQILAVVCVLALVLFLAIGIMWSPLMEQYLLSVSAPPLESAFGFRAAYVSVQEADGRVGRSFQVVELSKGGTLEQAGFMVGDILSWGVCAFNGEYVKAEDFLDELRRVQAGETVEFWVGRHEERSHSRRIIALSPNGGQR